MILNKITISKVGEKTTITYSYTDYVQRKSVLWFELGLAEPDITLNANSFVLGVLLISMKNNSDIDCGEYQISQGLFEKLELIQDKVIELFPELRLHKIRIIAEISREHRNKKNKEVGTFFTGGVDSFYVLANEKSITSLIYVIGFDIKATDTKLVSLIVPNIKDISDHKKINLDIVTTNLRELTEKEFSWEYMYGMALGSVTNLFSNYQKIYIPSSLDLANQTADGSHSELDYLYSNEYVVVENYGIDKNRIMKVRSIMEQEPLSKKYLRVCWKNVHDTYNCGVCEKCVRAKMELDSQGYLQDVETFTNKKILPYIKSFCIRSRVIAHYYTEIEKNLHERVTDYSAELRNKIKEFEASRDGTETVVDVFSGKKKNILFIDFNGVISYNPFWITIKDPEHKLNKHFQVIEEFIFRKDKDIVLSWMSGELTTEEVHERLRVALNIPVNEIDEIKKLFIEECKSIDISAKVLYMLSELKKYYHIILVTDNMDTFSRFTVPNNTYFNDVFDEIHDSYIRGTFKKSDNGKLFLEVSERYNVPIEYCTLIDDSKNNCACFSELGGRIFTPRSEADVLDSLCEISNDVHNKWEWQY